jgi:hypothetical protein
LFVPSILASAPKLIEKIRIFVSTDSRIFDLLSFSDRYWIKTFPSTDSYDEIAQIFTEQGMACKGATLKKYHLEEKKKGVPDSPIPELPEEKKPKETKMSQPTQKSHSK